MSRLIRRYHKVVLARLNHGCVLLPVRHAVIDFAMGPINLKLTSIETGVGEWLRLFLLSQLLPALVGLPVRTMVVGVTTATSRLWLVITSISSLHSCTTQTRIYLPHRTFLLLTDQISLVLHWMWIRVH